MHDFLYSPATVALILLIGAVLAYVAFNRPGSISLRVVNGVITLAEQHAKTQALQYFIVACLVLGAITTGFFDNFWSIEPETWAKLGWWQKLALWSKCLSAAPAVVIAWLMKSPLPEKKNGSTPPSP